MLCFDFIILRFKNLHFCDPVRCHQANQKIKNILIQNSQSDESGEIIDDSFNLSESMYQQGDGKFDIWAYHTSMASTQIQRRTSPVYQEVI